MTTAGDHFSGAGPSTRMAGIDQIVWNLTKDRDLFCIWAIATLEAPLKDDLVNAALERLIQTVPILNCAPEVDWLRGKWRFVEKKNPADLIAGIRAETDAAAGARLNDVFLNPVNVKECSMIRLISIDGPSKHYFVIQAHHLVVDGEGLKRICVLFADIYRRLHENKDWQPAGTLNPCRSWLQIAKNFTLHHVCLVIKAYIRNFFGLIRSLTRKKLVYKIIGDNKCDDPKQFRNPPYFESIRIEKESMLELKAFTKRRGVTVNDVFMAGLALATMKWNKDRGDVRDWLRFGYTANLRRWRGEPDGTFGNFSVILIHEERVDNLQTPSMALASTKAKVDREKKIVGLDGFLILAQLKLAPYVLVRRLTLRVKDKVFDFIGKCHAMTNIGIIFAEAGEFGHTRAVDYSFLAPTFPGGAVVYTVTTYQNATTIHLGCTEDYLKKESARSFLRLLKEMILEVISERPVSRPAPLASQ